MKKKYKVLVTGASGFVGSNLTYKLLKENHEVHILLRKQANLWRLQDILSKLHIHWLDLQDKKGLMRVLKKINPDYIFHLATYGAYPRQNDLNQMISTNIVGFSNLLESSKDISYKGFVNSGSSSEYGYKEKPMKETDVLEPDSFYAATKSSATLIAKVFAKIYQKPIVTFRLFSVYGPFEEPSRLIPMAVQAALRNFPLKLTEGTVRRDFVYVDDVVNAYLQIMKSKIIPGDIYNIGTGKQSSNDTVAKIIKNLNHNKLTILKGTFPKRNWDTNYWVANTLLTKERIQWSASFPLRHGLEKTYAWFVENQMKYKYIYGNI